MKIVTGGVLEAGLKPDVAPAPDQISGQSAPDLGRTVAQKVVILNVGADVSIAMHSGPGRVVDEQVVIER